jgi:hypothetical protein
MTTQCIDRLGALTDEHLSCTKQHGTRLLGFGLERNKPHCWPRRRFNDGFSVSNIVRRENDSLDRFLARLTLSFYKRLHIVWRNQSHGMPELLKLTAPAMRSCTSLHRNNALGLLAHKCKKLNTRQFLAENIRSIGASPVKLKHALCKVYADHGDF